MTKIKALTPLQKVRLLETNLINGLRHSETSRPAFKVGSRVRPVDFDYGAIGHSGWTWLDSIRIERLKEDGIVVTLQILHGTPEGLSPWSYMVRFKDGHRIHFAEENLRRVK